VCRIDSVISCGKSFHDKFRICFLRFWRLDESILAPGVYDSRRSGTVLNFDVFSSVFIGFS